MGVGHLVQLRPVGCGGRGGVVRLVVAVGTLLGPEETTLVGCFWWRSSSGHIAAPGWVWMLWLFVVVGCLFVENCTVDASIF